MTSRNYKNRRSTDRGRKAKAHLPLIPLKEKVYCSNCEKSLEDRCKVVIVIHNQKIISMKHEYHTSSGNYPRSSYRIYGRIVYNPRSTDRSKPY